MRAIFFQRAAKVIVLFVLLSLKLNAGENKAHVSLTQKNTQEKYTATLNQCGEIELTGTQLGSGQPQQVYKKTFSQLFFESIAVSENSKRIYLYLTRINKTRQSEHLVYIFPFHYFW